MLSYKDTAFKLDTEEDGGRMAAEIAAAGKVTEFSLGGGKTVSLDAMKAIATELSKHSSLKVADISDCFTARKEDCIYPAIDAFGECDVLSKLHCMRCPVASERKGGRPASSSERSCWHVLASLHAQNANG